MKSLKITLLLTSLLLSQAALSGTPSIVDSATGASPNLQAAMDHPGVDWSKAKDNCKKIGGKWKPIRRICKITWAQVDNL
jgi:hypothetical protein